MQWTGLSLWQWGLLAALPPAIIALYFLKLRRQPIEVPSTYLWHKSIEDLHVNSIWQRLRRSLLLLLQILVVALVILALFRPTWNSSRLVGGRYIFLVDNSASSAATDVAPSRLEEAKRQVGELIDEMSSGDVAMIVSFADSAQVVQSFTDNRRELRRRLATIQPTHKSTNLSEALRVASGLANPGKSAFSNTDAQVAEAMPARLYLFSDGKFSDVKDFALGQLTPEYHRSGTDDCANIGILAFNAQRNDERPDQLEAFARVVNNGLTEVAVQVLLLLDGETIDADELSIPSGEEAGVAFPLTDVTSAVLKLEIKVMNARDDLEIDNAAWAVINEPRKSRVLVVTPGNEPLSLALGTGRSSELAATVVEGPDYLTRPEYAQLAAAGTYDLVVFDRCAPATPELMPRSNTLFIAAAPPVPGWQAAEKVNVPAIIDTERAHPLMQLMDLGDVLVAEGTPLTAPAGGKTLLETSAGPMFSIAPREQFEDAVLGFEIDEQPPVGTNWPLRLSFPVFVLNVIQYLGGAHGELAATAVKPGDDYQWRGSETADKATVVTPQNETVELERARGSRFVFTRTDRVGPYEVREGKPDIAGRFAVNLFDPVESDIRPRDSLGIGDSNIAAITGSQPARGDGWRLAVMVALAMLLVEWYIYNRRVFV